LFDIITFVLGVLAGLGGIVLAIKGSITLKDWGTEINDRGRRVDVDRTYRMRIPGVITAAAGGLLVLISTYYGQDPGEAIVLKSFAGSIQNVDSTQGASFTAPWNSRISFDVRNQRIEMFTNRDRDGNVENEGDDGSEISAPTEEGTNVGVSITIRYSIRPNCVEDIYKEYKSESNLRDRALKPGLRDEVRVATAEYSVFEIKQRRADLSADLVAALDERWNEKLCVEIDDVDFGNIQLDETTEGVLTEINERQGQVEASRADLERAQIDAEVTKTEAQAEQAADQIIRCGATVETETQEINGVETEIDVVTPVPVDRCQNQLNPQVLTNNYIEALETIGADGNLVVVDGDINAIIDMIRQAEGNNDEQANQGG